MKFYVAIKMADGSKNSMFGNKKQLASNIPKEVKLYCSWQRGCNEKNNSLLREYYSKKVDISKVKTEDLIRTLTLINSRPRKCLNYAAPFEKFLYEIKF